MSVASTVTNSIHSSVMPSTYSPKFAVNDWNGPSPQLNVIQSASGTASGVPVSKRPGPHSR